MWSEEEMRDIPDAELATEALPSAGRKTGAALYAGNLRRELSARNVQRARGWRHEVSRGGVPSVIYAPADRQHGNFIEASYARICARPEWQRRLQKAHTSKRQARPQGEQEQTHAWCELDSAMSSDALLMNIFCYPRVLTGRLLPRLLGVEPGLMPEFGYKPRVALRGGLVDTTEVDMRLAGGMGELFIEAKLTESDFQRVPLSRLERYEELDAVFDRDLLSIFAGKVEGYQLVRGVMAAAQHGAAFCVLCDGRRRDLAEAWFQVMRAVRSLELQARLKLLTWQEVARCVPGPLQRFLAEKYGIDVE